MNLREALDPLLAFEQVLAVLVLTDDGLPVEMFGYGLHVDELAAQAASMGGIAARACNELGLGEPEVQRVLLPRYELDIVPLDRYYLTVVSERGGGNGELAAALRERLAPLRSALRGEA